MSSNSEPVLVARKLRAAYRAANARVPILADASVQLQGGTVALFEGPSGSGKTTLLSILGGLRTPDEGVVTLGDLDLYALDTEQRARVRLEQVAFVFQSFRLIQALTALDNVSLPLALRGLEPRDARSAAALALERVGMTAKAMNYPKELSGGEQQRVAIARAIAGKPRVLLADEPTANLDQGNSLVIARLLAEISHHDRCAVAIVTHDARLHAHADVHYSLIDGVLSRHAS